MGIAAQGRPAGGFIAVLAMFALAALAGRVYAPPPTTAPAEGELIQLNFPENSEVKLLVDYVGKRLGLNILYDETLVKKRLTISSNARISKDSLGGLLQNVLKASGLVMVDSDQPGWKRIVADQSLLTVAKGVQLDQVELDRAEPTAVVSQAFDLKFADIAAVTATIKLFLSTPGGTSFAIVTADRKLLVVTDYAANVRRVVSLMALMDQPGRRAAIQFVPIRHVSAAEIAQRANELLREQERLAGGAARQASELTLMAEPRLNQLAVISSDERATAAALDLIKTLDTPSGAETRSYRFEHISPQRIDKLAREFAGRQAIKTEYNATLDPESATLIVTSLPAVHQHIETLKTQLDVAGAVKTQTYRFANVSPGRIDKIAKDLAAQESGGAGYKSTVDDEAGMLIVTAAPQVHERIESLRRDLDVAGAAAPFMPIAFYKLTNTTAAEVLATIRGLESGAVAQGGKPGESGLAALVRRQRSGQPANGNWTGPNNPPPGPGQELPKPPAYHPPASPASQPDEASGNGEPASVSRTQDAVVSVDPNTNTVIVIAPPEVQRLYKQLVTMLDRRRPQVLIEATIVTLDTTNGFSLGVETSINKSSQEATRLVFSQFGLSAVNAVTGDLAIKPGMGFNGTLVDPETISIVVRALASNTRAEVMSAPKVLVNDNGTATLESVKEAPFTSVNASDTVATTTFAGYASAGTTLTVTPHISEGDHLQLKYTVTLSSFTGEGSSTVPPPRQTNTIDSEVVVPDGHAVIVGGLTRKDTSKTASKLPLLGDIPGLGYLFGQRTQNRSDSTLFVFIRPVILRDDQFEDLKYLSEQDARQAGLPADLPACEPMLIE